MSANGDLSCGRCGARYLRHYSDCGREIGAEASRNSWRRWHRYLCSDCADRAE